MWDVAGRHEDHVAGSADRDGAFAFGNINTNSVHKGHSFVNVLAMVNTSFPIACSIYWVFHTNVLWFNLRKTNAANEGLVG